MKLASVILGLIMLFGVAGQASAGNPSATEFIKLVEGYTGADKFWMLIWLRAQYTGTGWANARLNAAGQPMIYCVPGKLILKKERLFEILKHYTENTKAGRRVAHIPFGGVLLNAIIAKYPCR